MKITKVECLVASRSTADAPGAGNSIFVVTHTDEGLRGIGEAYTVGPDLATKEWIGYFAEQIVGHDPTRIEYLWAMMYQGARFPPGSSGLAALSGIAQSLWDITARAYGVPVYDLLGGRYRDRIRGYLDIGLGDSDGGGLDAMRASVRDAVDRYGYTAFKVNPLPTDWRDLPWLKAVDSGVELVGALRAAAGPDAESGLDAHAAGVAARRRLLTTEAGGGGGELDGQGSEVQELVPVDVGEGHLGGGDEPQVVLVVVVKVIGELGQVAGGLHDLPFDHRGHLECVRDRRGHQQPCRE